jgi:hypothetical protein
MADRYWVGGAGDWNASNTANWSATSGGAGGQSVPTASDNVFFDANSGVGTVSITQSVNCLTFDATGFTSQINTNNFGTTLNVYGSYILNSVSFFIHWNSFNAVVLRATTSGNIIRCNGNHWQGGGFYIAAPGGTYTLDDAFISTNGNVQTPFDFSAGTLNTNNYNMTLGNSLSAGGGRFVDFGSGSGTKVLNLGSSIITINATVGGSATDIRQSGSNLTFNPGTSKLKLINVSSFLSTPNITWYEVEIDVTSVAIALIVAQTFKTQILTTTGSTPTKRAVLHGNTGTNALQFLTQVSTSASLPDTDIFNIYYVGPLISGARLGDRGLNTGITFPAPKNCYRIGTGNWNANQWAATSGGTPDVNFFPLPQDIAVFDQNTTGGTHTINYSIIGTIDMSARTSALTLAGSTAINIHGNWKFGTGVTRTYSGAITFTGDKTQSVLSNGISFANAFTINSPRSTLTFDDAFINTSTITVTRGKLNVGSSNITVSGLASNNSNFREVSLGSSTITCTSTTPVNFSTVGLGFSAGTSTIVCNTASGFTFGGGGFTYYDVSLTGTAAVGIGISGVNTFNNLSIAAPSAAGIKTVSISDNQVISGTFTISGGAGNQRTLVFSNTLGTARTLTVGTLTATDCDFRDITIAGTAAGSSPTRAGDWGGNTGITFPAPKTVYWNLAGTQDWNANAWAATSGGSPDVNNFPLAQDTAVFNEAGSVGTVTLLSTFAIGTFNASARTSAMTLTTSTNAPVVYGNWLFGTGVTSSSTTGTITFAGRGTPTITSNGVTFGCPITIDCITGTVQLADALSLDAARTLTLTTGTFDAVTYSVTTGLFASSNSNTRTLKMGSGLWTLSGTGTVWNIATSTNLSLQQGTANILLSDTSATARTFAGGGLSYNKLTIGGATGTSTLTFSDGNQFTELASTKTVAHTISFGANLTFGKWSVTGTAGNVVTLSGSATGNILAGPATSGIDYLAMGSIGFAATSPGEFYAGANSTGTAGAPVFRTAPPAGRTLYWVGGTGNWNDTARWSLSSGGAGGAALPTSLDNVIFDSGSNATGYTATINQITGGNRIKSWTASGPAIGNVTFSGTNAVPLIIHDNLSFAATGVVASSFFTYLVFSGNQTGRTITTNGVNFNSVIEVNGVGCEWSLGSALISSSAGGGAPGYTIITNGTLDFNTYNFTSTGLFSQNNNKRTLDFGSGTITTNFVAGITAIGFSGQNFTFVRGTSTYNTPILAGALLSHFYNLTLTDGILAGVRPAINSDIICENNFSNAGSSVTARVSLASNTIGVTRTITCASATINNTDIRDITIAGAAAPVSPTGASDAGGNSGITFPAPKTVYRVGTNTTWVGSSSWALTSGGAGSNDNLPLYQDTAVIDENTALTGTLTISGGISALDCSTRTTGITLSFSASTWYGSLTLGSGVTVSGTGAQTFSSRSSTMTLTSAGKTITFPITVDALGGTFQLGDATTTSNTITHTRGTFNANNQNLTATTFSSTNSNVRTITMGSGTWTLTGTGTVWDFTTPTNLTFNKNTAQIVLNNTTNTARTFAGGSQSYNKLTIGGATGSSTLTFTGNNTFSELASTKTVAHTISIAATLQYVSKWTITGTSGNLVTLSGTTGAFVYTGSEDVDVDYMTPSSVQAYPSETWYIGSNSTLLSGLNFYLEAAPPPGGGNMFLIFM